MARHFVHRFVLASLPPRDGNLSSKRLNLTGPLTLTAPTPLQVEHAINLRSPHLLHMPRELQMHQMRGIGTQFLRKQNLHPASHSVGRLKASALRHAPQNPTYQTDRDSHSTGTQQSTIKKGTKFVQLIRLKGGPSDSYL